MAAHVSPPRLLILLLLLVATSRSYVASKPQYISMLPNGANVPGSVAIGHVRGNGTGALNAFGKAFITSAREWSVDLCKKDSDNDGQTNGQELGDPCCEWIVGDAPRFTTGISHPGDSKQTANSSRWINITCPAETKLSRKSKSGAAPSYSNHASVVRAVAVVVALAVASVALE